MAFRSDEAGAVLVEYAIVSSIFMTLFFALLDFGRLGADRVMGQKAAERAARIASLRDPICTLPGAFYAPRLPDPAPIEGPEGSSTESRLCLPCAEIEGGCFQWAATCTLEDGLEAGNATAQEIWAIVGPLFPSDSDPADVTFTYSTNPALGRVGSARFDGLVTAEIATAGQSIALPGITAPRVLHSTILAGDLSSSSAPDGWCASQVPFLAR